MCYDYVLRKKKKKLTINSTITDDVPDIADNGGANDERGVERRGGRSARREISEEGSGRRGGEGRGGRASSEQYKYELKG